MEQHLSNACSTQRANQHLRSVLVAAAALLARDEPEFTPRARNYDHYESVRVWIRLLSSTNFRVDFLELKAVPVAALVRDQAVADLKISTVYPANRCDGNRIDRQTPPSTRPRLTKPGDHRRKLSIPESGLASLRVWGWTAAGG